MSISRPISGVVCGAAIAMLGGLSGCDSSESMRGAESLFQLSEPMSPSDAARIAVDPWDADNRARGTMLLANAPFGGEAPYRALYLERAVDNDPNARAAGLRGLALHGRPDDVPVIAQRLSDINARVRLEAARALQRVHNEAAIEPLIAAIRVRELDADQELIGEREPSVRAEAARALGQYADPRVFIPLVTALDDPFLGVNLAAEESLKTLTGQDFGLDRDSWITWYTETEDVFAGRATFIYPVFERKRFLWERIPFVPAPPNETAGTPAGFPPSLARRDDGE